MTLAYFVVALLATQISARDLREWHDTSQPADGEIAGSGQDEAFVRKALVANQKRFCWGCYQRWPWDFQWSSAGPIAGKDCLQIVEPSDPHTWNDNYFCWARNSEKPGFRWSYNGPISGMRCTQIYERDDPYDWQDNYLCVPNYSMYRFEWSSNGPIRGKSCIQWYERSDPHTWEDNYLCAHNTHSGK